MRSSGLSNTRREIEQRLFIETFDNYGVSELMGPGIAGECSAHAGMHIFEDHFLPEIIDPLTCEVLPPGATGELVLTTLTREAFPLIRYRTGDVTSLDYSPCACGRTMVRMQRVTGRTDDVLIVKGINILPQYIENILMEIEGCEPHYQVVARRDHNRDSLEVRVEVSGKRVLRRDKISGAVPRARALNAFAPPGHARRGEAARAQDA